MKNIWNKYGLNNEISKNKSGLNNEKYLKQIYI